MAWPKLHRVSDDTVRHTLAVIEEFAKELAEHEPPEIPYDIEASTMGWSVRLLNIRVRLEHSKGRSN